MESTVEKGTTFWFELNSVGVGNVKPQGHGEVDFINEDQIS